ncbi:MAG: hypothetical protein ACSLFE_10220 [Gemmatimonadaceae bacterium]
MFYYTEEAGLWLYTLRLIAFLLILFAIIDKNSKASKAG